VNLMPTMLSPMSLPPPCPSEYEAVRLLVSLSGLPTVPIHTLRHCRSAHRRKTAAYCRSRAAECHSTQRVPPQRSNASQRRHCRQLSVVVRMPRLSTAAAVGGRLVRDSLEAWPGARVAAGRSPEGSRTAMTAPFCMALTHSPLVTHTCAGEWYSAHLISSHRAVDSVRSQRQADRVNLQRFRP
jgi:hypothetical protein